MAARLGPGVAVLVIGPTITGALEAIGCGGVISRPVARFQPAPELGEGNFSAGAGWVVTLERAPWPDEPGVSAGIFPATSLMPIDGEAEPEAITTTAPDVAHA